MKSNFERNALSMPELSGCYQKGLQALSKNKRFVKVENPKELTGSIYLDGCTSIPNSAQFPRRWDYIFGYKSDVLALEVHTLSGANRAKEIVEKAAWLTNWMQKTGNPLQVNPKYFVVASGGSIDNSANKILAQKGLISCGHILHVDLELEKLRKLGA